MQLAFSFVPSLALVASLRLELPMDQTTGGSDRLAHFLAEGFVHETLPIPTTFKKMWVGKKNAETHLEDDLPGSIKLVLGLFTIRQDVAYQQVAKETWMSQSGVCLAEDGPKPGCSVYVAFVLGREPVPEGMEAAMFSSHDFVQLQWKEGMDNGKSFEWFNYAARNYKWATHVGKIDMDAYPYIRKMVSSLEEHSQNSTCAQYVGALVDFVSCGKKPYCPREECGRPDGNDLLNDKGCWWYMQGANYILTRDLVEKISGRGGFWDENKIGPEDIATGRAVSKFANDNHVCVNWWHTWAYDHLQHRGA